VCCGVLRCVAASYSVLQCVAVCLLQFVAVCCSVLQCAALCCRALQCVVHRDAQSHRVAVRCALRRSARRRVAIHYCALKCVAACCSVLRCISGRRTVCQRSPRPCVAVCCSVLQCVKVCCSVFQCAAGWCSVLQCATMCCRWSLWPCAPVPATPRSLALQAHLCLSRLPFSTCLDDGVGFSHLQILSVVLNVRRKQL